MRLFLSLGVSALLAIAFGAGRQKDPHSAQYGSLTVTVTALEGTEARPHKGDRHSVAVFVSMRNDGKLPICMSFTATLKATYGLTYRGGLRFADLNKFPQPPTAREMLPGEETSGSYVFEVKDGVQPIELTLKPNRKTLHCGSAEPGWKEVFLPPDLRFDVHDLPAPKKEQVSP